MTPHTQSTGELSLRQKMSDVLVDNNAYHFGDFAISKCLDDLEAVVRKEAYRLASQVIGNTWPNHCDKGYESCNQCRNRDVLNGQILMQNERLQSLIQDNKP